MSNYVTKIVKQYTHKVKWQEKLVKSLESTKEDTKPETVFVHDVNIHIHRTLAYVYIDEF